VKSARLSDEDSGGSTKKDAESCARRDESKKNSNKAVGISKVRNSETVMRLGHRNREFDSRDKMTQNKSIG